MTTIECIPTPEHFTYTYLRLDGTPYYVGKGRKGRAFANHANVQRPKDKRRILLQSWSSEREAFDMEKHYIRFYGRQDKRTGILFNRTDGGAGAVNRTLKPPKTCAQRTVILF